MKRKGLGLNKALKRRPLRAAWTIGMAEDLRAVHAVDIEDEMTRILAAEIAAEIDMCITNDIINQIT